MATKKVGTLVKEARTAANLTQEQLAKKVTGATAADISALERGKVDFTQAQLKQIAKACDVTQSSLINAPKNLGAAAKKASSASKSSSSSTTKKTSSTSKSSSSSTAKKTSSASKSSSSSTAKKTSTSKSTSSSSKSTSGTSMKVSTTEKKLVELYREADSATKKVVMGILKGEFPEPPAPPSSFGQPGQLPFQTAANASAPAGDGSIVDDFVGSIIAGALELLGRR